MCNLIYSVYKLITTAKEVIFTRCLFVCLFICLSVCQQPHVNITDRIFVKILSETRSRKDKEVPVEFWTSSRSGLDWSWRRSAQWSRRIKSQLVLLFDRFLSAVLSHATVAETRCKEKRRRTRRDHLRR